MARATRWAPVTMRARCSRRMVLLLCAALAAGAGSRAGRADAPTSHEVVRGGPHALPRQQVLRRSLAADTSQSYLLYVPGTAARGAPLLVTAHGISRNFEEHARLFAPYAEKHGVVLAAPCFPEDEFGDYQRLGRDGNGRRADLALEAIVAEVESLSRAAAGRVHRLGVSGGAQFAHPNPRAHPRRIAGAAVAAAGWYAFPDSATPYPYGIGLPPGAGLPGVRFEPGRFLRVPITVFVGTADTTSKNLRRNAAVDRQQGATRLDRAQRWTAAMRRAAESRGLEPLVTCVRVPGVGHSFRSFMEAGGGDRVFDALFAPAGAGKAAATAGSAR